MEGRWYCNDARFSNDLLCYVHIHVFCIISLTDDANEFPKVMNLLGDSCIGMCPGSRLCGKVKDVLKTG